MGYKLEIIMVERSNDTGSGSADCTPSASPGNRGSEGAPREGGGRHEVFGDVNLGLIVMFLVLLQMLNYSMRDPCTC